jgi:phenylalanyl-tRNA synthetase beta chain
VRALKVFTNKAQPPTYNIKNELSSLIVLKVNKETERIRPFIVAAVLRNVTFTQASYKSFIELQDKLHQNICRKRTLVAIGTHDLDTLKAPFLYEAKNPADIKFVPLKPATKEFRADELLEFYEKDPETKHLKPYVPIIKNSDVYPVIYDSNGVVLSLPPIINGDHSKITLQTKNVFIECTATDITKAKVVLNTMVTMFSQYCAEPFTVEQVEIVYPDGKTSVTPDLSLNEFVVGVDYINSRVGVKLGTSEMAKLLTRMQLTVASYNDKELRVLVPPTRSDILHACDIMEDVAIAYGINNIVRTNPKTSTVGKKEPLNNLSDLLRLELAMAGFTEILTMILVSFFLSFKTSLFL